MGSNRSKKAAASTETPASTHELSGAVTIPLTPRETRLVIESVTHYMNHLRISAMNFSAEIERKTRLGGNPHSYSGAHEHEMESYRTRAAENLVDKDALYPVLRSLCAAYAEKLSVELNLSGFAELVELQDHI